jgi:catechol 2,3-dioxygenase-like lactoylglutathione lyase family enzyme
MDMAATDGSISFYFFDIDDNLFFLPTKLYLWNAETRTEMAVTSGEFAAVKNELGRSGKWQAWAVGPETCRDFCDQPNVAAADPAFLRDLKAAVATGTAWQGPSWPLLVHAAKHQRPIACVTARGHEPAMIEAGLRELVTRRLLAAMPPILGLYTVTNPGVRKALGATDPAMTVPSIKKMAIRDAVATALQKYGAEPPHRFGMSDDDSNNVTLAISAMRDCKVKYPDKRFFVINTNLEEFVKLEIFPMAHPVTAASTGAGLLQDHPDQASALAMTSGGNVSVYVSNLDRAIDFYTNKLGLPLKSRVEGKWAEIDAGKGLVVGLHPARPPETVKAGTIGAISIELAASTSLDDVVVGLAARGVQFAGAIQNYPNVRLVSVKDPDNNAILLAQVLNH